MNKQMLALMQRRGELLARIAGQREQVAATALRWQTPLALADKGLAVARFLRANPVLVAGALAVVVFRRRGMTGMLALGWRAWRLYQSARAFSAKIAAQTRR